MSDIESLARKLCAADGLDPDQNVPIAYDVVVGRNAGQGVATRRETTVIKLWEKYRVQAYNMNETIISC